MSTLTDYNFAYRWSYTNNYNTAVMGLNLNLAAQNDQIYSLFISRDSHTTIDTLIYKLHPFRLSKSLSTLNRTIFNFESIKLFHTVLFDPVWVCTSEKSVVCSSFAFVEPKLNDSSEFKPDEFFPGAFTYHLHLTSLVKMRISENSYFRHFETYFQSMLAF